MQLSKNLTPGITPVILIAAVVILASKIFHINANLLAITLGFLVGNIVTFKVATTCSFGWLERHALAIAVALLGVQLNLALLIKMDVNVIALIVSGLIFTFLMTGLLLRLFGLGTKEGLMVACGQGICGSAAVLAVQRVTQASASKAALIVVVVNFLGFLGVFLTPYFGLVLLGQDDEVGRFIGNTLQSMGHVVAAGFGVNDAVGETAVLVKMCRILMLLPLLLVLTFFFNHNNSKNVPQNVSGQLIQSIPWFIWGFLLLLFLNHLLIWPQPLLDVLIIIGDLMFVIAMVTIGLGVRLADLRADGKRLLLIATLVFIAQLLFTGLYLSYF